MDIKQKTLLIITITAFGYLGYQVYGLVRNDVSDRSATTQTISTYPSQMAMGNPVGPVSTAIAGPAVQGRQAAIPEAHNGVPKQVQIKRQPLARGQKAYLQMVNQYELAKMKRRLLEERASIAAAEHRIATLHKQTSDINESLSDQASIDSGTLTDSQSKAPYQLSYLDNQHGQWTATLRKAGRYREVNVGSQLPGGVKVVKINRRGVILEDGDIHKLVTFNGILPVVQKKVKSSALVMPVSVESVEAAPVTTANKSMKVKKTVVATNTLEQAARKALVAAGILSASHSKTIVPTAPIAAQPQKKEHDITVAKQETTTTTSVHPHAQKNKAEIKLLADNKTPATPSIAALHAAANSKPKSPALHAAANSKPKSPALHAAANSKPKSSALHAAADAKPESHTLDLLAAQIKSMDASRLNDHKDTLEDDMQLTEADTSDVSAPVKKLKAHAKIATASAEPASLYASRKSKKHYTADESRILHMNSHRYTIQLIGSYHRDIVENFAIANDLGNGAMQFHVNNRGKPWYMLLYGDYRTLAKAEHAMHQLPPNLTPERPWIRRVSGVQRDVKRTRG